MINSYTFEIQKRFLVVRLLDKTIEKCLNGFCNQHQLPELNWSRNETQVKIYIDQKDLFRLKIIEPRLFRPVTEIVERELFELWLANE